eukprot:9239334-Lingulodinium_polyedra.AAC.1
MGQATTQTTNNKLGWERKRGKTGLGRPSRPGMGPTGQRPAASWEDVLAVGTAVSDLAPATQLATTRCAPEARPPIAPPMAGALKNGRRNR